MTAGHVENPTPSRLTNSLTSFGTTVQAAIYRLVNPDFALGEDLAQTVATWDSLKGKVEANLSNGQATQGYHQVGPMNESDSLAISALFYDKNYPSLRLIYAAPGSETRDRDNLLSGIGALGRLVSTPDIIQNEFIKLLRRGLVDVLVGINIGEDVNRLQIQTIANGLVKKMPRIPILDPYYKKEKQISFPASSYIEFPKSEDEALKVISPIHDKIKRAQKIIEFTQRQVGQILERDES